MGASGPRPRRCHFRPNQSGRGIWALKTGDYRGPEQYADELPSNTTFTEGAAKKIVVNRFERERKARIRCLDVHGFSCKACGANFEAVYGPIGRECIHVHHIVPISSVGRKYRLDPLKELVPVCPNCHYMIHRREPTFTLGEIKRMLKANRRINADARG